VRDCCDLFPEPEILRSGRDRRTRAIDHSKKDLKAVALVVAVSHYKIAQVSDERTGILEHLEQCGNCPED
jgi:hypothetical protein